MLPKLKVYEVDYSFIISNYLDVSLWNKSWTLFEFKDYSITLEMYSINCRNKNIEFRIYINDNDGNSTMDYINYNLQNTSIKILKQQINGAMFNCIKGLEEIIIMQSENYQKANDLWREEQNILRQIAEEFLDENNVTNDDIREAYIDKFVNDNDKSYQFRTEIKLQEEYKILTELYITFLTSINGKLEKQRLQTIQEKIGETAVRNIQLELKEYYDQLETEEYTEDMRLKLEYI